MVKTKTYGGKKMVWNHKQEGSGKSCSWMLGYDQCGLYTVARFMKAYQKDYRPWERQKAI